jgi:iron complex outermembrane receptor protein
MVHPIFQVLDNVALNYGFELTYVHDGNLGGRRNELVVGFSPQWGTVDEQRFENVAGQSGDLVADFETSARNVGFFFEDQFYLKSDFRLVLGGRADWSRREFTDFFLADGDRSDEKTFNAFVPKLGFVWDARPDAQVYGNASRSYEPPLLLELTSFGAPEFLDLRAASAWQFEIGSRGTHGEHLSWDVAFYDAEIQDEILNVNLRPFPGAPFTIPSYRNVDRSRHTGLELGSVLSYADVAGDGSLFSWRTAYTWSRFRFLDDPVYADNELPGAPRHLVRTELRYDHGAGFWVAPNLDWSPTFYFVDSANTVTNDGYAVLNLKVGYDFRKFEAFFQATNLTDRNYSGSVQVDSEIGFFFEPSNGRSAFVGLRWKM